MSAGAWWREGWRCGEESDWACVTLSEFTVPIWAISGFSHSVRMEALRVIYHLKLDETPFPTRCCMPILDLYG